MSILAIDFGTAGTLAAHFVNGRPQVLSGLDAAADSYFFPSAVAFNEKSGAAFGWEALKRRSASPLTVVTSVKRLLAPDAADLAASKAHYFPFNLHAEENRVMIAAGGRSWKPEEIAAEILRAVKAAAEKKAGLTFTRAIVTVPAGFDAVASERLGAAVRGAGFENADRIAESSAVALVWAAHRPQDGLLGIYNLGGGFFETAVFEKKGAVLKLLSRECDSAIGGEDFSWEIARFFLEDIGNPALAQDPVMVQRCYEEAERAKCAVSHRGSYDVKIVDVPRKVDYLKAFSRYELGTIVQPLVERTCDSVNKMLKKAGLDIKAVSAWMPAGGPTRMPILKEALSLFTGGPIEQPASPDQLAVTGACLQGAILAGESKSLRLED